MLTLTSNYAVSCVLHIPHPAMLWFKGRSGEQVIRTIISRKKRKRKSVELEPATQDEHQWLIES